jgi:CoA:oxalate CoA-transferase
MLRVAAGAENLTDDALPLAGITVLDFSQFLAGPSCALRLADLGARVIKIERPQGGDAGRSLYLADLAFDDSSALFHAINRNKESYTADLKDSADAAAVRALLKSADVMIHNFRPGVMDRLGFGWDAVSAVNPRLIYAGVSGYGSQGPWRDQPGQDLLVQSLSGMAWLSGDAADAPVPAGLSIVDMMAGAQLCQGVLALLVRRGISGKGGRVDVSLMEAAIDLQFEHLAVYLNQGQAMPERSAVANGNVYLAAPYGIYPTADGFLALAMTPVARLGELMGLGAVSRIANGEEFSRRDEIKAALRDCLAARDTAWVAPVLDWPALTAHPGFIALNMTQTIVAPDGGSLTTTRCPIRVDGAVLTSPRAAPRLGADRAAIDGDLAA